MSNILDRDALYYPYIQIRDVNWLKATLLCFPQVRRMVPPWVKLHEQPENEEFRKVLGPRNEPLLVEEDVNQYAVCQAQQRLLDHIEDHEKEGKSFVGKYLIGSKMISPRNEKIDFYTGTVENEG